MLRPQRQFSSKMATRVKPTKAPFHDISGLEITLSPFTFLDHGHRHMLEYYLNIKFYMRLLLDFQLWRWGVNLKRGYRCRFVFENFEDSQQPCDLKRMTDEFARLQQLKLSALLRHGRVALYDGTYT